MIPVRLFTELTSSIDPSSHLVFSVKKGSSSAAGDIQNKVTYRYSNITCEAINMHPHAAAMNLKPDQVPTISFTKYIKPSVPMTKPTRFADIIITMLKTAPIAQTCLYHGFEPYFDAGRKYVARSSGRMNRLTSQPHASSLKERSCHSATNVKMSTVLTAAFFVPPSGM